MNAPRPTGQQTWATLVELGELFDTKTCWLHDGSFHFKVPHAEGATISVTPESGERFRVESCYLTRPCATVWCLADDHARLAEVVFDLSAVARDALPV
jgi:hypothetical protein